MATKKPSGKISSLERALIQSAIIQVYDAEVAFQKYLFEQTPETQSAALVQAKNTEAKLLEVFRLGFTGPLFESIKLKFKASIKMVELLESPGKINHIMGRLPHKSSYLTVIGSLTETVGSRTLATMIADAYLQKNLKTLKE